MDPGFGNRRLGKPRMFIIDVHPSVPINAPTLRIMGCDVAYGASVRHEARAPLTQGSKTAASWSTRLSSGRPA